MAQVEQIALDEALERAFERKRINFLEDYDLKTKPALIWQAWPSAAVKVDLTSEKLSEAISGGGGPGAEDGWWRGFEPYQRPSLVFDGLASTRDRAGAGWATEIHLDGHLSAGIWTFPETGKGTSVAQLGVADFYVDAFHNFAYLASRVFEATEVTGAIHVTATMHHADKLALLARDGHIAVAAPGRKSLRWPVLTTQAADMPQAGLEMAAQFMRAYGRKALNR